MRWFPSIVRSPSYFPQGQHLARSLSPDSHTHIISEGSMSSFNMFLAPHTLWSSKNTYTLYAHHRSPLYTSMVWLNSLACKVGWQVRKSSTGTSVTDHQWTNSAVSRGEPGWTLLGTKWATQGVHDSICLPMLYKDSPAI